MFHKILVPLDGTEEAEQALEPACSLARAYEGELRLVTVEELPHQPSNSEWELTLGRLLDSRRTELQQNLEQLANKLRESGYKVSTEVLPLGAPATRLLEEVKRWQADLVILFSHGRRGLARVVLGSVAERLTRGAPCPVMIVHHREEHHQAK